VARLFVTQRELNLISDLTKEIIKDIIGQRVFLYPVSELKTVTHDVYDEALKKIYDNPIAIDAIVDAEYQGDTEISQFGVDQKYNIELFVQYRDLVEKGINITIGDYFSFNDVLYEIVDQKITKTIFGQAEHKLSMKINGVKAREGAIDSLKIGPTDISYTDDDALQNKFVQQRGFSTNDEGETGDKRALVEAGVLSKPLTGPAEVSQKGAVADNSHHANAFYGEDD